MPETIKFQHAAECERFQDLKKALVTCVFQERLIYTHVMSQISNALAAEAMARSETPNGAAKLLGTVSKVILKPRRARKGKV